MTFKALLNLIASYVVSFIVPIYPFIVANTVLVILRVYAGIYAAKKTETKADDAVSGFNEQVLKDITLYCVAVTASQVLVVTYDIPVKYLPVPYMVSFYISRIEFNKVIKYVSVATGSSLYDMMKNVFSKLSNLLNVFNKK